MATKVNIHWYTDDERPDEKELVLIQDKHGDRYQALWIEEVNGWDCGNHGCIDATAIVAWTHLPKYDPTPVSLHPESATEIETIDKNLAGYNLSSIDPGYGWKLFAVSGGPWGKITERYPESHFIARDTDHAIQMFWDTYQEGEVFDASQIGDEYQIYSIRVIAWHPRIPTQWAKLLIDAGLISPK